MPGTAICPGRLRLCRGLDAATQCHRQDSQEDLTPAGDSGETSRLSQIDWIGGVYGYALGSLDEGNILKWVKTLIYKILSLSALDLASRMPYAQFSRPFPC